MYQSGQQIQTGTPIAPRLPTGTVPNTSGSGTSGSDISGFGTSGFGTSGLSTRGSGTPKTVEDWDRSVSLDMIKNQIGVETNLQIISKFKELNSKVLNLERELSEGKELQNKLQQDLETLGNSDSELNKKLDKFEETESRLAAIEGINKNNTIEKEKLEKTLNGVESILKLKENETIESKIKQLLGQIQSKEVQIQSKEDQIQFQEGLLREKELEIERLNDRFEKEKGNYQRDIRSLELNFEERIGQMTKDKEKELSESISSLEEKQREKLKKQIDSLTESQQKKLEELYKQKQQAEQGMIELDEQLRKNEEDYKSKILDLEEQITKINNDLDTFKRKKDSIASGVIDQLKSENKQLELEKEQLKLKYVQKESNLLYNIDKLSKNLSGFKERERELNILLERLRQQMSDKDKELIEQKETLKEEHKNNLLRLKDEYESTSSGLQQKHDLELARLQQDHESKLARLQQENESKLRGLQQRLGDGHQSELENLELDYKKTITRKYWKNKTRT